MDGKISRTVRNPRYKVAKGDKSGRRNKARKHAQKKKNRVNKRKQMHKKKNKVSDEKRQISTRNRKQRRRGSGHKKPKNKKSGKKKASKHKNKKKKNKSKSKKKKGKKIRNHKSNQKYKLKKRLKKMHKKTMKKSGRKNSNSGRSTCADDSCIDNAVSYIKLAKDKVKNFLSQVTRVEKSQKTASSKSGKKGLFGPIINRIREAGGGNLSSLKCNGNSSGYGAQSMTNLTIALGKCESSINTSCVGNLPEINMTSATTCKSYMTTFNTMLKKCIALTGADACTCWNNQTFTPIVAKIKNCDFSEENKKMTNAKKSCVKAFGACRKIEDSVSETLSACSAANAAVNGKEALKNGKVNKLAATSFMKKINETVNRNSRTKANMTCAEFVIKTKRINVHLFNAPLNKKVATFMNEVVNSTIDTCSTNEKTSLKAEQTKLSDTIEIIEEAIEDVQNDLKIQTGTTTSIDSININARSFGSFPFINLMSI